MSTLLITIVPSILILLYFFLSDKFKEPKGSIALVFFLGICICLPAGYINSFMENNFKDIFSERLLFSFLGPAWCEELLKFIILYFIVLNSAVSYLGIYLINAKIGASTFLTSVMLSQIGQFSLISEIPATSWARKFLFRLLGGFFDSDDPRHVCLATVCI